MAGTNIRITVKLFAAYQEACGLPEMTLEVAAGSPVATVRDRLIAEYPQLAQWRDLTRFGVNLQVVEPETPLHDGDEVVLIPPVSGGNAIAV
jgi:molybdopterin synthase sulfur carrier subunit